MSLDFCPECKVSLIGDTIPEDQRDFYGVDNFRREIGIEYPDKYDGVWEWMCPDCRQVWPSEVARLK